MRNLGRILLTQKSAPDTRPGRSGSSSPLHITDGIVAASTRPLPGKVRLPQGNVKNPRAGFPEEILAGRQNKLERMLGKARWILRIKASPLKVILLMTPVRIPLHRSHSKNSRIPSVGLAGAAVSQTAPPLQWRQLQGNPKIFVKIPLNITHVSPKHGCAAGQDNPLPAIPDHRIGQSLNLRRQ